jgi:hypothetical protein
LSGIDAMIAMRPEFTEARIVMLTIFEGDVEIQRALVLLCYKTTDEHGDSANSGS